MIYGLREYKHWAYEMRAGYPCHVTFTTTDLNAAYVYREWLRTQYSSRHEQPIAHWQVEERTDP